MKLRGRHGYKRILYNIIIYDKCKQEQHGGHITPLRLSVHVVLSTVTHPACGVQWLTGRSHFRRSRPASFTSAAFGADFMLFMAQHSHAGTGRASVSGV